MPFQIYALIGWAAGLFEGEGTVRVDRFYWHNGEKRLRPTPRIKLRVSMTDFQPIQEFADLWGGRVNGPYQYGANKPFWVADIDSHPAVRNAARAMYPSLSPRRQRQLMEANAI